MNDQIWRQLNNNLRSQDFLLQTSQKLSCTAMVPLLKAMDMVKPTGDSKLKELLGDVFKILS
ncbi:hypothetical protein DPMN_135238 [Dreissena polymorpha]|uniref:Uncharacterized protein n=1 Tax=Dreissena polymorpha TaxID=45954 RepID=A0A9D4G0K1_DREPO|nr:hypothetical protein DPMN_135238 [Dreissena polymorpha]